MTYQDLILELQGYTPEQLKQNVVFQLIDDAASDEMVSLENVDWVTTETPDNKLVILV